MKNKYILLCTLFMFNVIAYGQGLTCDQAEPFCASSTSALVFPNTSNSGFAETGPDYGCLVDQPNPAWYFLQIGQSGDIDIEIEQNERQDLTGAPLDVDFICYGPFTSTNNCGNLTFANTVGCSYSLAAIESFTIPGALAGEIYILLITNYQNQPGYISLNQTNLGDIGAGDTDCSIVNTINYCEGDVVSLDGTDSNAVTYIWYEDGVPRPETGPILNNIVMPTATYMVEKFNSSGGLIIAEVFNVVFNTVPVANTVTEYQLCDDSTADGFTQFDLSTKATEVIGAQTDVTVSYYASPAEADSGFGALPNLFANTTNSQTIYARIENNNNPDCYDTTSLDLTVLPAPTANPPGDMLACDDVSNDGIESFDLSLQTTTIIGSQTDVSVTYHASLADAEAPSSPLISPYNSGTQTIYVRVEDDITTCYQTTTFQLIVNSLPSVIVPTPLNECDDNSDGFENFMLTDKITEILNGQTGMTVTFYANLPDAQAGNGALTMPYTNANASTPETLFVRVENDATGCYNTTTLDINVNPLPTPQIPMPIEECDIFSNGEGTEVFDLTIREADIIGGMLDVTATYYEDLSDAEAGNTGNILDPTMFLSASSSQTIYVRVTNNTSGCYDIVELDLVVLPFIAVIAVPDMIECELNTDGLFAFDLESRNDEILNGQDPAVFTVTYHVTSGDAQAGVGALVSPYTNINNNPQEIFVTITNTVTGCSISTVSFFIEVQESAVAITPANDYVICDYLNDNDGMAQFDLTTQDAEILGPTQIAGYSVTYYEDPLDAEEGVDQIPTFYENLTNPQVIYARVKNDNTTCFATTSLTLRVELRPIINIDNIYFICEDSPNGVVATVSPPTIDTGLNGVNYNFVWTELSDPAIVLGSNSSFVPSQAGNYGVLVTNIATGCEETGTTEVIQSSPPDVVAIINTLAFADTHVIEATATGAGEYEFSLDGGPWVTNNPNTSSYTFTDVSLGEHTVFARDINGCGQSSDTVLIMDYPLYFTPNGDGIHETWEISGISNQPDAKIYIYDRYGKLLKQLSPNGSGWDGTFNGAPLPSTDYWFIVEYREPVDDVRKEFKAHFTLKR